MIGAGKRINRIRFEAPVRTPLDVGGDDLTGWTLHFICDANIKYGTGSERREAAQEAASAPATFRVPSSSETRAVDESFRIVLDGAHWDISSIAPSMDQRELDITAIRRKG